MLHNDFYTIQTIKQNDMSFTVEIAFNLSHSVFAGHFPERPVVPAVFALGIIKECASICLNTSFKYTSLSNCKFINALVPNLYENIKVCFQLTTNNDEDYFLSGEIKNENTCFVDLKSKVKKI